jgi:hypothetical protein
LRRIALNSRSGHSDVLIEKIVERCPLWAWGRNGFETIPGQNQPLPLLGLQERAGIDKRVPCKGTPKSAKFTATAAHNQMKRA